MSAHTPGPWRIRAERYKFIHVYSPNGGIAHLDTIDGEGAANARLIAAAPDLLAALRGVLRVADRATDEFDAARAAIEKATKA